MPSAPTVSLALDASRDATVHSAEPSLPAPLWAVLVFTFLNSVGSAVATAGIFYLAQHEYHFSTGQNFALSLVWGLTYIPAAGYVGKVMRGARKSLGLSPRTILAIQMLAMGGVCWLPWLVQAFGSTQAATELPPVWPIWVLLVCYSVLSGMLWPNVESFMAGGRMDRDLSAAAGKFNITWSASLVISMLAMGCVIDSHASLLLPGLGLIHISCLAALLWFPKDAGSHAAQHKVPSPKSIELLGVLRLLLPVCFMFISALSPFLPEALGRLGIDMQQKTAIAAVWYAARVGTFFVLERWHGWRGLWRTPIVGLGALVGGFGLVVLGPQVGGHPGVGVLLAGLTGFGVGAGVIYAAALYYAMEVGSDGIDAGGTHEMVIGFGYAAGPACGLAALAYTSNPSEGQGAWGMLVLICLIAVLVGAIAAMRVLGHTRKRASS